MAASAALVGSLAEAASAACDRVLRGLPASSTMRELIARALGSRRRVGGRCEAVVLGRCGGCCTGVTGPRPRAPRATPGPWPDGPLRARAPSGRPGGAAGVVGSSRAAGCPRRKAGARDGPRSPPSEIQCGVFSERPSFSHVLANVLPLRSESQSQS